MVEWTNELYKRKVKKPVFKGFFYWGRTSPVEHRKKKLTFFRIRNRNYHIVDKNRVW